MTKHKLSKKKKVTTMVVIAIIAVIALFMLASPTKLNQQEYNTPDGLVKIIYTQCGTLCELIQPVRQTVYFDTSEYTASSLYTKIYNVGDTITLYSRATCEDYSTPAQTYQDAVITTTVSGPYSKTFTSSKMTNVRNHEYITTTMTFPSSTAGDYTVTNSVVCYKPGQTTQSYSQSYGNIARRFTIKAVSAPLVCPSPGYSQTHGVGHSDYANTASISCELWSQYTNTGTQCVGTFIDKNCKTTCNAGYYCDSSFTQTTCDGKMACAQQPVIIPPTAPPIEPEAPSPATPPTETPATPPAPIPTETNNQTYIPAPSPGSTTSPVTGMTNASTIYIILGIVIVAGIGAAFYIIKLRKKRK